MNNTKLYNYWIRIIVLLTFFQYGFYTYIHKSRLLNQIDDFLILLLFIHIIFSYRNNKAVSINKSKYDFLIILLILIASTSSILNQIPLSNFLLGMKGYFLYFIFFYCIYWIKFSETEITQIMKFSLNLFIIELVISILQLVNGIAKNKLNADIIFGTFNGSNYFGYAIFALLYFSFYMYYLENKKQYLKYTLILAILLLMSSARFAILLFPIIFVLFNIFKIINKFNYKHLIIFIIILLIIPLTINNSFMFKNENIQDYFSYSFLKNHFSNTENEITSGSARNLWYPLTKENLQKYSYNPLIGFGPGMYSSYAAMQLMPRTNYLVYDYFNQTNLGFDPEIDSQIIPIWGELGYIGIIVFYILLFFMLFRLLHINKEMKNPIHKAISSTACAYTLFFIIGFYIHHVLESQTTAILLFLLIGFSESQYRTNINNKKQIKDNKKHQENKNESPNR